MSQYTDEGYESRQEYLKCLAEDYGVSLDVVIALAEIMGPNEDFDGLVNEVEDLEPIFFE